MILAALTFLLLAQLPQAPEIPLRFPGPGKFSATPICGADHEHCKGRASLFLDTEYGPFEVAGCEVRAGEAFALSIEGVPVPEDRWDNLAVQLALEGHPVVRAEDLPLEGGCDIGRWRVPDLDSAAELRTPEEPRPASARILRLELRGGNPRDALLSFIIPDPLPTPGGCTLSIRNTESGYYGLRRVDSRVWELDLDHLDLKDDHFSLFVRTLSGACLEPRIDWKSSTQKLPAVLEFDAPPWWMSLRGTVVDSTGKPVANAIVRASFLSGRACFEASATDGSFQFDAFAAGTAWINVNDANWRSRGFRHTFVEIGSVPAAPLELVVQRQNWMVIDASGLALGPEIGAVLAVGSGNDRHPDESRCLVISLKPEELTAPFRLPACWGSEFAISAIPMPAAGREHDGDLDAWIKDARIARSKVSFPSDERPGVTRFLSLKPDVAR
ncbi:MAG TPA: carboxypeptidase-like regulatory domain-containing protein [Planctomycetota bacterium]|nr:carboxypeptidase-like regulatory domain-containing protein [Planctomycetota bacterium]